MASPSYGVIFHPTFPPETLADYARRAELAGFDELWLWDDCFLPGALSAAAIALSATERLKVGIGLLPATVQNSLFTTMELTTLTRAFPNRVIPGFGYGFAPWMAQIGAAPKSFMRALSETVQATRRLLAGELVTTHGEYVHLDQVQMRLIPTSPVPLYIGGIREKTLQLAGRIGDGTILTGMSSPAYIRWAWQHVQAGMAEARRTDHQLVVYLDVKVSLDGAAARAATRQALATRLPWPDAQVNPLGIEAELASLIQQHGPADIAQHIPDAWVDQFAAAGTPEQALQAIQAAIAAGATTVVFQPLDGDPACLEEYRQLLMPQLQHMKLNPPR